MAKFRYSMSKRDAILAVKRSLNGKVAIMSDSADKLKVGAPMITAKITFTDNQVETSASLFGKAILNTVNSCIELTEGFEKIS